MKLRRLIVAAVAAALFSFSTLSVSAATTSDIINKLEANGASSVQIAQAKDFFKSNSGSFTSAQLDTVSANIDKIETIMADNNVTDPADLPASAKAQVKTIVTDTAAATGVSVEFGKSTSGSTILTLSKNGNSYTFSSNDSTPKTTGSNNVIPFAALVAGMLLVAGSSSYVLANRKKATAL